ncbi:MAG: LptF/LptG family permease [Saprospiraceae bacterium]
MKKIDKLLLSSSFGPFIVSFGIALFVLVMQFLWLYIDEIAGKGVSILILIELISYLSVATFPMALPIAVLLASVMVMGNLAERYELSSMKSAGVSVLRVMRSLIFAAAGVAFFSYVCSDYLIPIANLKFKARLYDIRKQKPALTIEEGVFNEDFRQFVIRVGDKKKDDETITDVMIEDQTRSANARFNQILADSGQMFTTADKRFFVMNLFDGTQYQEPNQTPGNSNNAKYPFVRTNFKSWTKVWDLGEFDMNRTDEDRFKQQRSMLSMNQLRMLKDSLRDMMLEGHYQIADDMLINIRRVQERREVQEKAKEENSTDSTGISIKKDGEAIRQMRMISEVQQRLEAEGAKSIVPAQKDSLKWSSYSSFLESFDKKDHMRLRLEAFNRAKTSINALKTRESQIESRKKEYVKTGYELYIKYSYALVCLVFLFIGGPMGAIIRKGGFGYPILVSIIFFVIFVMLSIVCKKLAELYILTPFWAAMTPCLILMPFGALLTWFASRDQFSWKLFILMLVCLVIVFRGIGYLMNFLN